MVKDDSHGIGEVPMTTEDSGRPVAGLFDHQEAPEASRRLERAGIATAVADGRVAAEGKLGRRIGRGALIGALVGLPLGVVLAIAAWLRVRAGVPVVIPLAFITPTIIFLCAFIGVMVAVGRGERVLERDVMVVTRKPLDERQTAVAEEIVTDLGGEQSSPVVERTDRALEGDRRSIDTSIERRPTGGRPRRAAP